MHFGIGYQISIKKVINGSQVRLISTRSWVRGGGCTTPPAVAKTTGPIIEKIVRGLESVILSTNMQY